MRRILSLALLALALTPLALAVDWAPGIPPHPIPAASAQVVPIVGPGGVVDYSPASVSCTNSTASCSLYNGQAIPVGFYATSPSANLTYPGVTGTVAVRAPVPFHLTLRGVLSTNSAGQTGTINAGASFGSTSTTTATIALLNAHTPSNPGTGLSTVPIQIDVWYSVIATAIGANTGTLSGRVAYVGASGTETVTNSFVIGTTSHQIPEDLNVEWRWGSAAQTNALTIYNRTLQIGN